LEDKKDLEREKEEADNSREGKIYSTECRVPKNSKES